MPRTSMIFLRSSDCRVSGSQHVPLKIAPSILHNTSSCVLRAGNRVYGETKFIGMNRTDFLCAIDFSAGGWIEKGDSVTARSKAF